MTAEVQVPFWHTNWFTGMGARRGSLVVVFERENRVRNDRRHDDSGWVVHLAHSPFGVAVVVTIGW